MGYDDIDVTSLGLDAGQCISEAEDLLNGKLKAMKWINRSQGKTYDLKETKRALELINQLKKLI